RIFSSLIGCVVLLCGCRGPHYVRGHGDAGKFMLQHALAYGGHPVATNGLPAIAGDWQYVQDEFGVGVLLPGSEYERVCEFFHVAFGPPSNSEGWAARDFGATIMVQREDTKTAVGIYPLMSKEKMGRAMKKITEMIEKNIK